MLIENWCICIKCSWWWLNWSVCVKFSWCWCWFHWLMMNSKNNLFVVEEINRKVIFPILNNHKENYVMMVGVDDDGWYSWNVVVDKLEDDAVVSQCPCHGSEQNSKKFWMFWALTLLLLWWGSGGWDERLKAKTKTHQVKEWIKTKEKLNFSSWKKKCIKKKNFWTKKPWKKDFKFWKIKKKKSKKEKKMASGFKEPVEAQLHEPERNPVGSEPKEKKHKKQNFKWKEKKKTNMASGFRKPVKLSSINLRGTLAVLSQKKKNTKTKISNVKKKKRKKKQKIWPLCSGKLFCGWWDSNKKVIFWILNNHTKKDYPFFDGDREFDACGSDSLDGDWELMHLHQILLMVIENS